MRTRTQAPPEHQFARERAATARLPVTRALALCRLAVLSLPLAAAAAQTLPDRIRAYEADRGSLERFWTLRCSPQRIARLRQLALDTRAELAAVDFDALDQEGRIDWLLLRGALDDQVRRLDAEAEELAAAVPLLPFAPRIVALAEARQRMEPLQPQSTADELQALAEAVAEARQALDGKREGLPAAIVRRAAAATEELHGALGDWYRFGEGYDPTFSWWLAQPYAALREALEAYAAPLRDAVKDDGDDKLGRLLPPLGAPALRAELRAAGIAYTPEELLAIGERELAWCEPEMRKAASAMGCATWHEALERVKADHVAPGEQPALIRELALEAIDWVEQHELLTIPPLAKETWRMAMMSPERQLVTPFFTGGEVVSVSFPTDGMRHPDKRMSLRGNNRHFARATVHHELIPGHHLQAFMTARWATHRAPFATPFWTEGWALWFELLLWEQGFARSPQNAVGMLFWRAHRCARVRFSLGYHLGTMTAKQCVDLLVDGVGHERANAEAEVRRSFAGEYAPLYQCAYLIGGLQLRALHQELVASGRMTDRAFHDAILRGGNMPIELVRARLAGIALTKDWQPSWRFYGL